MEIDQAIKMVESRIAEIEELVHNFEYVLRPRLDADRRVLEVLKAQHLKMSALQRKMHEGIEVPIDEVYEAIPKELR